MEGGLSVAVVSIARTRRRRFAWAAWWSGPPEAKPFRKPDAHGGGSKTREEAHAAAEAAAGRPLGEIEARWAEAWCRVMQGQPAFAPPRPARPRPEVPASLWSILGVAPDASVAEIKRGYRQRALETHPDRGGDAAAFRELQRAYERAIARKKKRP
jgi:hypothetical protein